MAENFIYTRRGCTVVYVDGACFNNGRPNAAAGIGIYFGWNNSLNLAEPLDGRQTNNRAEIVAARVGIEIAGENDIDRLIVRTDSTLVVRTVNEWMDQYRQNGWRLANGRPVKNRSDWQDLDDVMWDYSYMNTRFQYVEGHSGDPHNNEADKLAKQGARMSFY